MTKKIIKIISVSPELTTYWSSVSRFYTIDPAVSLRQENIRMFLLKHQMVKLFVLTTLVWEHSSRVGCWVPTRTGGAGFITSFRFVGSKSTLCANGSSFFITRAAITWMKKIKFLIRWIFQNFKDSKIIYNILFFEYPRYNKNEKLTTLLWIKRTTLRCCVSFQTGSALSVAHFWLEGSYFALSTDGAISTKTRTACNC